MKTRRVLIAVKLKVRKNKKTITPSNWTSQIWSISEQWILKHRIRRLNGLSFNAILESVQLVMLNLEFVHLLSLDVFQILIYEHAYQKHRCFARISFDSQCAWWSTLFLDICQQETVLNLALLCIANTYCISIWYMVHTCEFIAPLNFLWDSCLDLSKYLFNGPRIRPKYWWYWVQTNHLQTTHTSCLSSFTLAQFHFPGVPSCLMSIRSRLVLLSMWWSHSVHLFPLLIRAFKKKKNQDVCRLIDRSRNILCITGAGLSVSAGIPDFRSAGGIYTRLKQEFGMPEPECMFDLHYFQENPQIFYSFAHEVRCSCFEVQFCQLCPCWCMIGVIWPNSWLTRWIIDRNSVVAWKS